MISNILTIVIVYYSILIMVFKGVAIMAAAASVAATTIELPPCTDPFQPFVYSGCFGAVEGNSPLTFRSSEDQTDMSVEECVQICKGTYP